MKRIGLLAPVGLALALVAAACTSAVSQEDHDALKTQLEAAKSGVVQAGNLQPAPAEKQLTGWDTPESMRGGLRLVVTYDSSGPDAWDPKAHPLVYLTSEGMGYNHRPSKTNKLPGVQVIDATTKEVVASKLYDLGGEPTMTPHGLGVSPDGKWSYIGFTDKLPSGENRQLTLVINTRTLKLDKVLTHQGGQRLHHVMGFTDAQGRDRVVLEYGFGANGGPHFMVDPKDNNKVVRAITVEDTGYKMGHPFLTVDPAAKFLYVSLVAPAWRDELHNTGGIAKVNVETGAVTVVPYTGDHPIGIAHTADGQYTYVADGHGSLVYKIDNKENKVVGNTSAGIAGPYGLALNWDESELWVVGKGEGSHNTGGVLGVIDTKTFRPANTFNQPVNIGGAVIDHAFLHPDPNVNELWVSSAGTWETIVVDLNTKAVKARIPSPNGGDTHSGAFVRYNPDWTGEVLADHGGPHTAMYKVRQGIVAKLAAARP
ncbi:MAG: YncE family protein [Chloroflexi bacterium]|nr:YncE family protein [Chloroflexota bacterium]